MKKILFIIILISVSSLGFAQNLDYNKLIEEGKIRFQNNELNFALIQYQQAIKLDSSRVEGYYGLGVTQAAFCHNPNIYCNEAIQTLSYVIKLDPNYRNAYYNRGNCKNAIGDFSGAVLDFNIAIKQYPDKTHYYMSRSFSYLQLGNKTNACKDLKKAAELNSPAAYK